MKTKTLKGPTEKEFLSQVTQLARLNGWMVYHTHDSRHSAKGFPDLVLVRERLIFAELKSDGGKLRPEQAAWLAALNRAGVEAYLWGQGEWPEIEVVLRGE